MRSSIFGAVGVLLVLIVVGGTADASGIRPIIAPNGIGPFKPARMPLALSKEPVTVVVQLPGDPVSVQEATTGRKLAKSEKDDIKANLKRAQAQLHERIIALGGTILGQYQVSYNGIKVQIARDKASELASLPGVIAVRPLLKMKPDNTHSVELIGTTAVWESLGFAGQGIKIGIIDTGIDYTHADFGGPGRPADYATARAAGTLAPNPAWFGPGARRVKGGIDLVGDDYDADSQPIPHPDPNPLDCNGHGSHVAGTVAGSGVTATGTWYKDEYDDDTIVDKSWNVGPGVAPLADIYTVRIFGCDGSTTMAVDGIEWAVDNGMNVINLSLGSPFGDNFDPVAEAANNAAKAGIVVVASAGDQGANPYLTGSPGSADGAIASAANQPLDSFAGASFALGGGSLVAIDANDYAFANGKAYPIAVIRDSYPGGSVALGCAQSEYDAYIAANGAGSLSGKMIVTLRGSCSRAARAVFAQRNAAAAALMINNAPNYPPFDGPISGSAETGPFSVTIPFFGARGADSAAVVGNDGGTAIATNTTIANPDFLKFASFSSGGPRTGDSFLKPDLTAPGVSLVSTAVGSGSQGIGMSGTSMASALIAGVAALTLQAHSTWSANDVKAAVVNTASPAGVADYETRRGGAGFVQPDASTRTRVVAHGDSDPSAVAVNFGFAELDRDFTGERTINLVNSSATPATFRVTESLPSGVAHSIRFDQSMVTVPAHGSANVLVTLTVPITGIGNTDIFSEIAGLVTFSPTTPSENGGATLRVPYYLVARARAGISTHIGSLSGANPTTKAMVVNNGASAGNADFYGWGLESAKQPGKNRNDVLAIGVQSFPASEVIGADAQVDEAMLVFAVNTSNRWSNASTREFDIFVDVDGDGIDDYVIVGADNGSLTAGDFDGRMLAAVFSLNSDRASTAFLAVAPTDGSTALLPVLSRQLCMDAAHCLSKAAQPRLRYHAQTFDVQNFAANSVVPGSALFNAWANAISTGGFATVAAGATDSSVVIAVNSAEWARTPAHGLMIVTLDNPAGAKEAQLIRVNPQP